MMDVPRNAFTPHPDAFARVGQTHVLVRYEHDDPSVAHSLLVPAGWLVASRCPGEDRIGQPRMLAMYLATATPAAPTVGVSRLRVATEIDAEDLVVHRCAVEGWTVLEHRTVDGIDGPLRQIASIRESPEPRLRVSTWRVDGGRLFQVDAVVAAGAWSRWADAVLLCGPSFALRTPTGVRRLGPTHTVRWSGIDVELPSDWGVAVDRPNRLRAVAVLGHGRRGDLELRRIGHRDADRPERLGARIEHVVRRLGARMEAVRRAPDERGFEVDLRRGSQPLWLRATAVSSDAGDLDVITIAPSAGAHLDGWCRARRAHALAVAACRGPDRGSGLR